MMKAKPLTKRQTETMKKHKKHHTAAHMKHMTKMMGRGATFGEAHKSAMKKVGK